MKKVYTFSIGGSRDDVYLESLSSTKEGVKDLIRYFLTDSYVIDECETIRDILIDDVTITIIIDDIDLGNSYRRIYRLITFSVS